MIKIKGPRSYDDGVEGRGHLSCLSSPSTDRLSMHHIPVQKSLDSVFGNGIAVIAPCDCPQVHNAFHRLSLPERLFTCVLAASFILGYHFVHFSHIRLMRTRLADLQTGVFMSWISSNLATWHSSLLFPRIRIPMWRVSPNGDTLLAHNLRKSLWPFAARRRRVCRVCGSWTHV